MGSFRISEKDTRFKGQKHPQEIQAVRQRQRLFPPQQTMQQEIVTHIQTHYSADGVEVRSVGPKAVTLSLPPELHDLGNLCGELECMYNARIDIEASSTPGLGPIATVWVQPDEENDEDGTADRSDPHSDDGAPGDAPGAERGDDDANTATASKMRRSTWAQASNVFYVLKGIAAVLGALATINTFILGSSWFNSTVGRFEL